jgi:hypothetical protein
VDIFSQKQKLKDEIKVLEMELTKAPVEAVAGLMEKKQSREASLKLQNDEIAILCMALLNVGSMFVLASQRASE